MTSVPSGEITFLVTEIEGSVGLWEAHPEAMQSAHARYAALLRGVVEAGGGSLFRTRGDGVCAAFPTAPKALSAALEAQQALTREVWPNSLNIRVRMGLHTGTAEAREGNYTGPTVSHTARLMNAGYGGQILLSEATQESCQDALPPGVSLRNSGSYYLRGLARPERLFQVVAPTLPATFPALQALESMPNNLFQQVTSFIGREVCLAEVSGRLAQTRLLTLTGTGGIGKSRLALQIAAGALEEYSKGVWLVGLTPVTDPTLVPQAVASVLGARETSGQSSTQTLVEPLKDKHALLVLDDCERLAPACAALAETLMSSCPALRILATSRESLGSKEEQTYQVPPLSLPDDNQAHNATPESLRQFEATRLFVERAQSIKADFAVTERNAPIIAQLCQRMGGIPLALELAAVRLHALPLEEIYRRLDKAAETKARTAQDKS